MNRIVFVLFVLTLSFIVHGCRNTHSLYVVTIEVRHDYSNNKLDTLKVEIISFDQSNIIRVGDRFQIKFKRMEIDNGNCLVYEPEVSDKIISYKLEVRKPTSLDVGVSS